ncbi:MAG: helix-turn-helix transcriptional regulator [Bacteroidetes bacterium]|nr:helix-turn-helix transcriptional regulator [Bacteroidota bacterium]
MSEKFHKPLGSKIRILRQMQGISQKAIAVKLNISQAAYSKIENKKTILTEERLKIILKELNVSDEILRNFDLNEVLKNRSS